MRAEFESLEKRIGYRFADREILHRALTHSSHAHEYHQSSGGPVRRDNEQLEFLGDAVLGFLISELLVQRFPGFTEGRLSPLKGHLVSANHLQKVAQSIDIGPYLRLGRSEEMSGGRLKKTLLVDALEALIAALYLDGGMQVARTFVEREVLNSPDSQLDEVEGRQRPLVMDYKTALQELAFTRSLPPPRYAVVREEGPGHSRMYTVEVRLGSDVIGRGEGSSKKGAAQKAARRVYEQLVQ